MPYFARLLVSLTLLLLATPLLAAGSLPYANERITASLITSENGVAPGAGTISAALSVDLAPGWKTYWKSPGEVGYPPEITWSASENFKSATMFWPAPVRFDAFGIENYGYKDNVTYPIQIALENPGEATRLVAEVNLLACSDICVPETFQLDVELPKGTGIDPASADEISRASATVPGSLSDAGFQSAAFWISPENDRLEVSVTSARPISPDLTVFPDMGVEASFGPPKLSLTQNGTKAVVELPIRNIPEEQAPFEITLASANGNAVFDAVTPAPAALASQSGDTTLLFILAIALLGGLILNIMPCVLPVLSIKLASAMSMQDASRARIRAGFLASAAGVLTFMLALAGILVAIRLAGGQIGWGIQFQSPAFLALMLAIMTLFAANMLGLFEINLPQSVMTKLANADGKPGLTGDFATGALAAILATPCSAPFLGTAVAFALAGSATDTLLVFTALGLGLAIPYLVVAAAPSLVSKLPKPGPWMAWIKFGLGLLLGATAIWIFTLLLASAGLWSSLVAILALAVALVFLSPRLRSSLKPFAVTASIFAALGMPPLLRAEAPAAAAQQLSYWTSWQPSAISGHVIEGKAVFVDVTADWCLTCKTNKALVLDRDPIAQMLASDGVVAMQADWTRPNPEILAYLQENGRFGIPFNIVYGPRAPQGIILPEILTSQAVIDAMNEAIGAD